jgi:glycosyltransferase involved in cell wall biosynthesis
MSVLTQTFNDFELILVDDGSDSALDELKQVSDPRILYLSQENKGPAAARNAGIRYAKGKYIAFLDSDDLFLPHKLQIQFDYMEKNPDIALSHTSYIRIGTGGAAIERINSGNFSGKVYPDIILCCPIATPTVMVRKDIVEGLQFEESVRLGEDVILWINIAKKYEIRGIDEALTNVRIHGSNAIHNLEKQVIGSKLILKYAFRNDSNLSLTFKLKAKSMRYNYIAYLYHSERKVKLTIWCFILSVLYWPSHCVGLIKLTASYILGKRIR